MNRETEALRRAFLGLDGEAKAMIARRIKVRRLDCPLIFHRVSKGKPGSRGPAVPRLALAQADAYLSTQPATRNVEKAQFGDSRRKRSRYVTDRLAPRHGAPGGSRTHALRLKRPLLCRLSYGCL